MGVRNGGKEREETVTEVEGEEEIVVIGVIVVFSFWRLLSFEETPIAVISKGPQKQRPRYRETEASAYLLLGLGSSRALESATVP